MPRDIVVGAGPAGLTAAWELTSRGRRALVLEQDEKYVGGLSRTVVHNGNRFDIGGHRFFTKSPEIAALWDELLPDDFLTVERLSRIAFDGQFFPYPLQVSPTLRMLGLRRGSRIVGSYLRARIRPRTEITFEDWVINRFGRHLYEMFFRSYTEKVWGVPCHEISKDFAAQRIRGLSLAELVRSVVRPVDSSSRPKTLVEMFRYPRLGPGQFWERVASLVAGAGASVAMGERVVRIEHADGKAEQVVSATGRRWACDQLYVTMSLRDLVRSLDPPPPADVLDAADQLRFRDFLTVAVVVDHADVFPDTWIYIHDPGVDVGRVQNYGNWSADMVADAHTTCLGLEYFCNRGDELWSLSDDALAAQAVRELGQLGLVDAGRCRDTAVVRMVDAYPIYDNQYLEHRGTIRAWLDGHLTNVHPAGRGGLHNYNSQDHAMETARLAVGNQLDARHVVAGAANDPWAVNTAQEYAEAGPTVDRLVAQPIRPGSHGEVG